MADNKTKIERIHDLLPAHLKTRQNINWKGIIDAIGQQDQLTADLVSEVRKQFFVKTASRPYLDRLAANNNIARPRLVGMDDASFRDYIPVLSYKPKQVKLILDALLDIFFFKESTTAYITTSTSAPFYFNDGWELEYVVDEVNSERIEFNSNDFTNINSATANEVVAAINRQAKYSYATVYYDSVTKRSFIRMFTKTVGSKGSLRLTGGRGNVSLRFNGFIDTAGNGADTQWNVSKIGDLVTLAYVGGTSPNINELQIGDIAVINLSGNVGSFAITDVNIADSQIKFKNLFSVTGPYTQTDDRQVRFIRPSKFVAYTNPRRAMTWETAPSEIVVEMPTSPPVVKRELRGSFHLNGIFGIMSNRNSDTSLTLDNASSFPKAGTFWLEQVNETQTRILTGSEDVVVSKRSNSRLEGKPKKYSYASRTVLTTTGDIVEGQAQITNLASTVGLTVGMTPFMDGVPEYAVVESIQGTTVNLSHPVTSTVIGGSVDFGGNTLTGISPALPIAASLNQFSLTSLTRTANEFTATTAATHGYAVGDAVIIFGASQISGEDIDGTYTIKAVTGTTFKFDKIGVDGTCGTPGSSRVERVGLANSGSKVILVSAVSNKSTRITGTYMWDLAAPFVLSSASASTVDAIQAGKIVRLLNVTNNDIPAEGGDIIFDFGKSTQEGPVRYLFKPTAGTIAIDPSYVFKHDHSVGTTVNFISSKGPHRMSGDGSEFPPYITDPSDARIILQELIKSVKSAGIFVNFLVRFPEQLYATLDVYRSGDTPTD